MLGNQFLHLNLANCHMLENDILLNILKTSPDLLTLDISGCEKITQTVIQNLCSYRYCQQLEKLYLNNLPNLKQLTQANWFGWLTNKPLIFPQLRRLSLQNCHNLIQVNISAAKIETVLFDGTPHYAALGRAWMNDDSKQKNIFEYIRYWETKLIENQKMINKTPTQIGIKVGTRKYTVKPPHEPAEQLEEDIYKYEPNPRLPISYARKAEILINLGRYNKAYTSCMEGLKIDASNNLCLMYRIVILYITNNFSEAMQNVTDLLKLNPKDIRVLNFRANILYQLKRYAEAVDSFHSMLPCLEFKSDDILPSLNMDINGDIQAAKGLNLFKFHGSSYLLPEEGKKASLNKLRMLHEDSALVMQENIKFNKKSPQICITFDQQWQKIAVLIAFMRVNKDSVMRYSVIGSLSLILKMTADINSTIEAKPIVTRWSSEQRLKYNLSQTNKAITQPSTFFAGNAKVEATLSHLNVNADLIKIEKNGLTLYKTKGEGDCAFHAILGINNGKQYECINVAEERAKLAKSIMDCKPGDKIYRFVIAGIEALVMGAERENEIGTHIKNLRLAYQAYMETQEVRLNEAWVQFENDLTQNIQDHINTRVAVEEKSNPEPRRNLNSLRKKFNFCLNIKTTKAGEILEALIQSDQGLNQAFQNYNNIAKENFNLQSKINLDAINDYAIFIGRLHQWLLPHELALIAYAYNITLRLNTFDAKNGSLSVLDIYNPGTGNLVEVRFNGRDHYERIEAENLVKSLCDIGIFKIPRSAGVETHEEKVNETKMINFIREFL